MKERGNASSGVVSTSTFAGGGVLLSAFCVDHCGVLVHSPNWKPVDFIHDFSSYAHSSLKWTWEFSTPKKMASWGNSGLGEWEKMIVWWNTTSEWMPVGRLAKNCLLWHYICFLCLFLFKGKEKLKSPLRIGRWIYLAQRRGEERLRLSKVSREREQWSQT